MPRRKRAASPFEMFDDEFDDDCNSQSSRNDQPPIQRNAANARERARMRVLSSAFGRLKTKLPNIPADTKLSKLDTLRLATMYIKQLRALAEGNNSASNSEATHSMQYSDAGGAFPGTSNGGHNMTWPFGLHHVANASTRQLPYCPSNDWSPASSLAQEASTLNKCPQLNGDDGSYSMAQNSSSNLVSNATTNSIHPWYFSSPYNSSSISDHSNSNFNVFTDPHQLQHNQNPHLSHVLSTTSAHHQNTMAPIR